MDPLGSLKVLFVPKGIQGSHRRYKAIKGGQRWSKRGQIRSKVYNMVKGSKWEKVNKAHRKLSETLKES